MNKSLEERNNEVTDILETVTQQYFDNICAQLSNENIHGEFHITKDDLFLVRSTLGPITYNNFVAYIEAMGAYDLDES